MESKEKINNKSNKSNKNNKSNKSDKSDNKEKLLVIAYANKENVNSINYRNSLKIFKYKYKIVGKGEKWVNYLTKIKAYYKYLNRYLHLHPDYFTDLVCITDCYDVLACKSNLINKFKSFNSDIVFSAEPVCLKEKCIYLDKLNEKNGGKTGENKYLNSGFIIGKINKVIRTLKFVLDQEQYGITDDQLAFCMYVKKQLDKGEMNDVTIKLDTDCKLVGTIGTNLNDFIFKNGVIYTKSGNSPCFIHTPGNSSDFSYRLDYFGKLIFQGSKYEYLTDSFTNKLNNFNGYLKGNKSLKLIGVVCILILLFLIYLFPNIIILYIIIVLILLVILSI